MSRESFLTALQDVAPRLLPLADEEVFFSVLDDVHVLTTLPHAHVARSNHGKTPQKFGWPSASTTRKFSWSNVPAPPEVAHLGPDVWRSDKPPHERGFVVLGTPIGHPAFIQAWADERLQEVARYAAAHDADARAAWLIAGAPEPDAHAAWLIAGIPATLGGLGLQVVPQQWLTHTTAPGVVSDDRRRLDMVIYGVTRWGRSADAHGVALATATRGKEAAYPELLRNGPLRLVVLGSEVGGYIVRAATTKRK
ncbi:hypothetical protein AK812_SmicGene31218 [Symbiodinium microadriaticum]|uniref:Uncharacterized protein n=1 Tax=Symbiodinium microadriaticum TaxID=2951 RepID=A0A1Q9CXB3_SYMMI|nr:hypothetical protein AK812_SmicGene31218 [Symbiodinium microadriaticum]